MFPSSLKCTTGNSPVWLTVKAISEPSFSIRNELVTDVWVSSCVVAPRTVRSPVIVTLPDASISTNFAFLLESITSVPSIVYELASTLDKTSKVLLIATVSLAVTGALNITSSWKVFAPETSCTFVLLTKAPGPAIGKDSIPASVLKP